MGQEQEEVEAQAWLLAMSNTVSAWFSGAGVGAGRARQPCVELRAGRQVHTAVLLQ